MSILSQTMYSPLDEVADILQNPDVTLTETQGALINVIGVVRQQAQRIAALEASLANVTLRSTQKAGQ